MSGGGRTLTIAAAFAEVAKTAAPATPANKYPRNVRRCIVILSGRAGRPSL
jgi:hypothetical protein